MKFTQLLTALSVATFAVAVPTVLSRSDGGSCAAAGGTTQCCAQKFGDPDNKDIIKSLTAPGGLLTDLLGLNLDGVVKDTTAQVGVACSIISPSSCQGSNVCCGNSQTIQSQTPAGGLLNIPILSGTPVNVCGIIVPINVL